MDPHLSYSENRVVSGIDSVKYSVDSGTQELIATNEQLQSLNIATERNTKAIEQMAQDISLELSSISDQIETTNRILYWGLSNIVDSLDKMEQALQGILAAVEDTDKAWAYAQYRHCLENYRKGLHREAVERISYAINGLGETHLGFREDHRFHFLLGSLYLGRKISKPDQELLDPQKAEEAFVSSARYAEHDFKNEAANAYLNAGLSALALGSTDRALSHVGDAIKMDKSLTEAYFQQGKILCKLGDAERAFDGPLKKAIAYHPLYAEKAAGDEDIKKYKKELDSVIIERKERLQRIANSSDKELAEKIQRFETVQSKLKMLTISDVENIKSEFKKAKQHVLTDTLVGVWEGNNLFSTLQQKYRDDVLAHINTILDKTELIEKDKYDDINERQSSHDRKTDAPFDILHAIIFVIMVAWATYDFWFYKNAGMLGVAVTTIPAFLLAFYTIKATLAKVKGWSKRERIRNNYLLLTIIIGFAIMLWPEESTWSLMFAPITYAIIYVLSKIVTWAVAVVASIFVPHMNKDKEFRIEKKRLSDAVAEDKKILLKLKESV